MRLPPLPTIKDIIRLYKLRALKQLSQNFLLDHNISRKIVRAAGRLAGTYVCEVGPGPGGITRAILEAGVKELSVIEKDKRFLEGLELLNEASNNRLRIYLDDVLDFDLSRIFPKEAAQPWSGPPPDLHLIGNLPFNVSTPLIIRWLRLVSERRAAWRLGRVKMTLTFQHEVAERMAAPINHDQRCRLSIMCQYLCHVQHRFTIPGRVFQPAPDVDVGVVTLLPRKTPLIGVPFPMVEKVMRHTFHFRRKMCKRGIQTLFPPDRPDLTRRMFEESEVQPDARPFMLEIEHCRKLCDVYKNICDEDPEIFPYDYRTRENALVWRRGKLPLEI